MVGIETAGIGQNPDSRGANQFGLKAESSLR